MASIQHGASSRQKRSICNIGGRVVERMGGNFNNSYLIMITR